MGLGRAFLGFVLTVPFGVKSVYRQNEGQAGDLCKRVEEVLRGGWALGVGWRFCRVGEGEKLGVDCLLLETELNHGAAAQTVVEGKQQLRANSTYRAVSPEYPAGRQ